MFLAVKDDESPDPVNVGGLSPPAVVPHADDVPDLIEELRARPCRERNDVGSLIGIGHDRSRERTACQRSRAWMAE